MILPAFHLNLNEKIQRGQATVGKYDGCHPSLTCATIAGKIFLHNPHATTHGLADTNVKYLNINKQITAVIAGCLAPVVGGRDVLLVGTPSNLQCYDVDNNKDLFFKDTSDGVNICIVGKFGAFADSHMAIIGGNCSIQGYDSSGAEKFWTVTGDNVSAMTFCDVDGDGKTELLVGSDDFDIRVFQNEDVVAEVSEADQFVALCPIVQSKFGYALVNGTIGVYDRLDRIWRVKSKHSVCAINSYDLDGDGVPELISGWSSGRMEVRRAENGEVVYRDTLGCAVSAVLCADYRNDGMQQAIVCGLEGEVRGYLPEDASAPSLDIDYSAVQALIAELAQHKQELMYELASYQNTRNTEVQQVTSSDIIPANTRVDSFMTINKENSSCDLVLKTNNDAIIRGVVLFGEFLFEQESLFSFPKNPDTSLTVPLRPPKDVAILVMLKVLVGQRASSSYHVFELEIELPKFSMYAAVEKGSIPEPVSKVSFTVNERIPRLANWAESRFTCKPPAPGARTDLFEAYFVCLRDSLSLVLKVFSEDNFTRVNIHTDNMDLAGEIVTDLAAYVGAEDLASIAEFPKAMSEFKDVLTKVEESNATRLKMNADMADSSNLVKQFLIKAEDVRILGDMSAMKKYYRQVHDLNRDLIAEHEKRATNHKELLENLKEVNMMIQRAARLRVGAPKTKVVSLCRAAVKTNNMQGITKVIRDGE